jgi:hypothetical protein
MIKLRSSLVLCATICAVIVLALTMSAVTHGSSLRVLSHNSGNTISHGPVPPPDDDGGNGGNIISHGPVPPPDDDGGNGGNIISHGPVPPPDDDGGNGGNLQLV